MTKTIKAKLNKIIKYAQTNSSWINKIIVFGEVLTSDTDDEVIELAAEFNEAYDIDECFDRLITVIDDITEGMFELIIMNGDNLTSNTVSEIAEGEIIYEVTNKT